MPALLVNATCIFVLFTFFAAMPRPTDSDLLDLAFRVLEDVLARAHDGPVPHSWGVKLALAVVARSGIPLEWHCRSFWKVMADQRRTQAAGFAEYERVTLLTGTLDHWYYKRGRQPPDQVQRGRYRDALITARNLPSGQMD